MQEEQATTHLPHTSPIMASGPPNLTLQKHGRGPCFPLFFCPVLLCIQIPMRCISSPLPLDVPLTFFAALSLTCIFFFLSHLAFFSVQETYICLDPVYLFYTFLAWYLTLVLVLVPMTDHRIKCRFATSPSARLPPPLRPCPPLQHFRDLDMEWWWWGHGYALCVCHD